MIKDHGSAIPHAAVAISLPRLLQPRHRRRAARRPTGHPGDDQRRRAAQPAEAFHETEVLGKLGRRMVYEWIIDGKNECLEMIMDYRWFMNVEIMIIVELYVFI